ncbi:MAG TPA: hypothetical protein VHB21_21360, partial [Minicystis sp.]|nr:hypothetical protein [Minicystis sp.]
MRRREPSRLRDAALAAFGAACVVGGLAWGVSACSGWDPSDPFSHHAPEVDEAIAALDAGKLGDAADVLERYLGTGACGDAGIGLPDAVRLKPNGSFDLGLTLFYLAEKYGRRFGDEEADASVKEQPAARASEIACALVIVDAIANDPKVPLDLR